jgi:hypothetical protein
LLPFQLIDSPVVSTARQKVVVGHETSVMTDVVPYTCGSVQEEPFHIETPPATEMQKVAVGHDMDWTLPQS